MVKALQGAAQNLPADVNQLIDQLERHCLAPDGSLVTKSAYSDLQLVISLSVQILYPQSPNSLQRLKSYCIDIAGERRDVSGETSLFGSYGNTFSLLPFVGFISISGFSSFTC